MSEPDPAERAIAAAEACAKAMQGLLMQPQHQGALIKRLVEERERTSAALDLLVPLMRSTLDRLEDLHRLVMAHRAGEAPQHPPGDG
jgi:hypothetical protein